MRRNQIAMAPAANPQTATSNTQTSRKHGVKSNLRELIGPHPSRSPQRGARRYGVEPRDELKTEDDVRVKTAWESPCWNIFSPMTRRPDVKKGCQCRRFEEAGHQIYAYSINTGTNHIKLALWGVGGLHRSAVPCVPKTKAL